jgi:hypothetical protein
MVMAAAGTAAGSQHGIHYDSFRIHLFGQAAVIFHRFMGLRITI